MCALAVASRPCAISGASSGGNRAQAFVGFVFATLSLCLPLWPRWPHTGGTACSLYRKSRTISRAFRLAQLGAPEHWHAYLMRHVKLIMHLPAGSLSPMGSKPSGPSVKVMAVVAIFGRVQTTGLQPRRKETRVHLCRNALIDGEGPRLGPRPGLVHRVSLCV